MGGAAPVAAAAASPRPRFFQAALDVLDGEGFILQVQGVFTRIRFGWWRAWIYYGGSRRWEWIRFKIQTEWLQLERVKNPKGFGFYL
jgi:hypothetical protein